MSTTLLICAEYYRTDSQVGDADDYMVDGIRLLNLGCEFIKPEEDDHYAFIEGVRNSLSTVIKEFLAAFDVSEHQFDIQRIYPKFCRLRRSGQGYWIHAVAQPKLESLPKEFNSRGFTDEQLLGTSADESSLSVEEISFYFNSAGDCIEGPPDKFMLSIGAV